jgi:type VI protein secretion system component Hcp
MLIQNPNLPGESTEEHHVNWIDLLSYSQTIGTKPCAEVFALKHLDRSSPGLAALAVTGQVIQTVTVESTESAANPLVRFRATLGQVVISSVTINAPTDASFVIEQLKLLPRTLTIEYIPVNNAGQVLPPITGVVNCK